MNHLIDGRVSIVLPVYNTDERFLSECIESVRMQDYEDIELIVVDDGSTDDNTKKCCERYAAGWERLILITTPNSGVSSARKTGLDRASGSRVMFLDSDDRLEPGAVKRLVAVMTGQHSDAVISQSESGKNIPSVQKYCGKEILRALLDNTEAAFGWALWAKLFDTTLMKECYRVYSDIYYGEDLLVNALFFAKAESVVVIDDKLYFYRTDNPDSAMAQARSVKKLSLISMWKEMAEIYGENGMTEVMDRIWANYYDSLLSGYLQCEYYRYDNYKVLMADFRKKLKSSLGRIMKNKYVASKYKYLMAIYFRWVFRLKRFITNRG